MQSHSDFTFQKYSSDSAYISFVKKSVRFKYLHVHMEYFFLWNSQLCEAVNFLTCLSRFVMLPPVNSGHHIWP